MLFSSIGFLYYFLPVTLFVYFIVPFKLKNLVLLIASLAFYFYGEPVYTFLMLGTSLSAYIHGLLIDRFRGTKWSRVFLCSSVIISVLVLGFFKYSDFFVSNLNNIFGSKLRLLGLALPIGISFYTFQTLSYTIDVYRGDAKVQKNFISLATYVALFPQLIAGPIVRYTVVEEELSSRTHSFGNFSYGVTRFAIGLGKKVLIADTLGALATSLHAMTQQTVGGMWIYAIAVSLQIYFDFSGYSDMAIGLGRIFGFKFLENFNYPFISTTVAEFWRRWHISLGSWFRDYVYIPLGGNRVSLPRWGFNILAVWFLTGFWHGADWNFIVWGLYFAVFLICEKFFLGAFFKKLPTVFSRIYLVVVILISFVIFNGNGMNGVITDLAALFGIGRVSAPAMASASAGMAARTLGAASVTAAGMASEAVGALTSVAQATTAAAASIASATATTTATATAFASTMALPLWSAETSYYLSGYILILVVAIIGATPLCKNTILKIKENEKAARIINILEPVFVLMILMLATAYFVDGSFSPFLYFRF
ncbi:MAG: MBOAT family O-acyltransferase [Eubacteriales bacterium]|nr:MBOAT family O-acyltransferase [Eubacteriales bacterium]